MTFYPRFYVTNTYDNRMNTAISAMHSLYDLITLVENESEKESLYKAYEAVAEQFAEMTKNIPEKNGVKTIDKTTKYYANGLVKAEGHTVIAKPFAYAEINKTTIKPKYNIFPKQTGYRWYRKETPTTSTVLKSYLKYKLTGKVPSGKTIKISELYNKIQTLLSEFEFDENLQLDDSFSFETYIKFIEKYAKCYTNVLEEYMDLYKSLIHKSECDNVYGLLYNDTYRYYGAEAVSMSNEALVPKLYGKREYTTSYIAEERNATYSRYYGTNSSLRKEYIPFVSEKDADKFVELYNKLFYEKLETLMANADGQNNTYGTNIQNMILNAESHALELCHRFYEQIEQKAGSRRYENTDSYTLYGHNCMLIEATNEFNNENNEKSKIVAKESIVISNPNHTMVFKSDRDESLELRYDIKVPLHRVSDIKSNIKSNIVQMYQRKHGYHDLESKEKAEKLVEYKEKAERRAKEIFRQYIEENKEDIENIIENLKKSLETMAVNLLDINATFFDIENEEFTRFLIKKKIISEELLEKLESSTSEACQKETVYICENE